MVRIVIAFLLGGLLAGSAGFAWYSLRPARYEMIGTLIAPDCSYGGGLKGANITIHDQSGNTVGSTVADGFSQFPGKCFVVFTVDVPQAKFYQIFVNNDPAQTYSFAQMVRTRWRTGVQFGH